MSKGLAVHKSTQTVGDVEVTTAIRVQTPEHDKLAKVHAESQAIGAFLDWLIHQRDGDLTLCQLGEYDNYYPAPVRIEGLLAEYFEVDEAKLENEKRALLDAIRR